MDLEFWRNTFNAIPQPTLIVDAEGTLRFANSAAHSRFGYADGDLTDFPVQELLPALGGDEWVALTSGAARNGGTTIQTPVSVRSGERRRIDWHISGLKFQNIDCFCFSAKPEANGIVPGVAADPGPWLQQIVDNSLVGIVLSQEGRVVFANDAALCMVGYTWDEIAAIDPEVFNKQLMLPEDLPGIEERNVRIDESTGVGPPAADLRLVRKDRSMCWVSAYSTNIQGSSPVTRLTMLIDITSRKSAERGLQESEERYATAIDGSTEGLWEWNVETNALTFPDQIGELLGIDDREEAFPRSFTTFVDFLHPDDRDRTVEAVQAHLRERKPYDIEFRLRSGAGDYRWIRSRGQGSWDESGKPTRMIGSLQNISKQKETEKELRRSEERFRNIAVNSLVGIAIRDEGQFTFVNDAIVELTGYSREEMLSWGPYEGETHIVHPEDLALYEDRREALDEGNLNLFGATVLRILRKDGTIRWASMHTNSLIPGERFPVLLITVDITEQKEAEAALRKRDEELRQSQKMQAIGQLAGGIAHDFNNLIQAIQGHADMLLETLPSESDFRTDVGQIIKASERGASLIRQLLTFSRRQEICPRLVDLNQTIDDLINLLRHVIGEHVEVDIKPDAAIGKIFADPGQIEQIIMNLCVNARDAMPDGGTISVKTADFEPEAAFCHANPWVQDKRYVRLTVADEGKGVPPEIRDRIFEPFFTTKEIGHGTGLGLATAYAIVTGYRGHIGLDPRGDSGARFSVYLPVTSSAAEDGEREADDATESKGSATLLLAEDDDIVRELSLRILRGGGYTVLAARDGQEACEIFAEQADNIDGAVLDVIMPRKNGRAVFEAIREKTSDLPILFTSGYGADVLDADVLGDPNVGFIHKPHNAQALLRAVRERFDADNRAVRVPSD